MQKSSLSVNEASAEHKGQMWTKPQGHRVLGGLIVFAAFLVRFFFILYPHLTGNTCLNGHLEPDLTSRQINVSWLVPLGVLWPTGLLFDFIKVLQNYDCASASKQGSVTFVTESQMALLAALEE